MKNLNKILIPGIAVMALGNTAFAQTKKDSVLYQSMTVEREFSPIVRDANKIDQQPAVTEIKVKKSPTRYSDWMAGEAISGEIGRMPAGQVIAFDEVYKRGFLEFSAGNYVNADLKAEVMLNEEFSLDIDGFYTKADLDLPNNELIYPEFITDGIIDGKWRIISSPEVWKSRMIDGNIKVNYNHLFSNGGRIRAYALVGGRNYNMLRFVEETKQKLGRIWTWTNYEQDDWNVDVLFRHNGLNLPGISDNGINVKPGYMWQEDDWQLKLAIDLAFEFGGNTPFSVYPELEFSKYGYGLNRFYAKLLGGTVKPDLYEIMKEFPLALPYEFKTEKTLFDLTLGYEDNNNGSFKWNIYAGAKMTLDRLDGFMCNCLIFSTDEETAKEIYGKIGHIYHGELSCSDEFELKVGGSFDYQRSKMFGIKGAANLNSNPQFGKPLLSANLHFLAKPVDKLSFDLGMDAGIKREMEFRFPIDVTENIDRSKDIVLGNVFDLNLYADYQLLPNLNVFLFGKNLLNQEYQLWAGVPAQKINIHAGFNWKF